MEAEGSDSVESAAFFTEETAVASSEKLDRLVEIAGEVKTALSRRSMLIMAAIVVPLVVGAVLLWGVYSDTRYSRKVAQLAYVQALINNRDSLQSRRDFAQTRDCPVEYFRELLRVNRERGNLDAIEPPCEKIDVSDIDAKIADVERTIREVQKGSTTPPG